MREMRTLNAGDEPVELTPVGGSRTMTGPGQLDAAPSRRSATERVWN